MLQESHPELTIVARIASVLIGAVVGLIAATIFGVVLSKFSEKDSKQAIQALYKLVGLSLGAGVADYLVFDYIFRAGALPYYLIGFAVMFLILGIITWVAWWKKL